VQAHHLNWCSVDYLTFCLFGSGVFSANVGRKIFIALQQVVPHHFIERFAGG
jgi:hypothetical protein